MKLFDAATAEFDEIVDSIADVFRIGYTLEDALDDGFQLVDLLQLAALEPVGRELIRDAPAFWAQFKALDGDTAVEAAEEAKARVEAERGGQGLGKVGGAIFDFLIEIAHTYGFITLVYEQGKERFEAWRVLLDTVKPEPDPEA